jgi:type I restriction enzyme S subunit
VKENINRLVASQTGGAQQHINKNNVNELPVICPSECVVDAYVRTIRATFDRIKENCFESHTLGALRDALLPKLISGELRVEDPVGFLGGCD